MKENFYRPCEITIGLKASILRLHMQKFTSNNVVGRLSAQRKSSIAIGLKSFLIKITHGRIYYRPYSGLTKLPHGKAITW